MFVLKVFSRLPLGVLYVLSDLIFFIAYHVLRYRRGVVMTNLENSFPQKSKKELRKISRAFYKNLCDYAVETLRLYSIDEKDLRERVVFTNPDVIKEFTDKNRSVLLLVSHQFNWEWMLAGGCLYLPVPVDFVYLPQSSKLANTFALAIRTRFGAHAIAREKVGREALRRKHIIRATAIVADQYPGHFNHRRYWATFLEQRTAFFYGITQLATLQEAASYFGSVKKRSRGHYEVTLVKLDDSKIIDDYIQQSEKVIHEQPESWLWSHRRWKNRE
ncbi:MAG: lysophospholipid acyltransferase family protein [Bacteroidota bacterium]